MEVVIKLSCLEITEGVSTLITLLKCKSNCQPAYFII